MDAQVITNLGTGLALLIAIYTIVNRSEDRITKRMDDKFTALEKLFMEHPHD